MEGCLSFVLLFTMYLEECLSRQSASSPLSGNFLSCTLKDGIHPYPVPDDTPEVPYSPHGRPQDD